MAIDPERRVYDPTVNGRDVHDLGDHDSFVANIIRYTRAVSPDTGQDVPAIAYTGKLSLPDANGGMGVVVTATLVVAEESGRICDILQNTEEVAMRSPGRRFVPDPAATVNAKVNSPGSTIVVGRFRP